MTQQPLKKSKGAPQRDAPQRDVWDEWSDEEEDAGQGHQDADYPPIPMLMAKEQPCLQRFLAAYGGYDKVPQEAWVQYDREVEQWQYKVRFGEYRRMSHVKPGGRRRR